MYYVERAPFKVRFVEVTCVDISTDWVPLFDVKIQDNDEVRFVETIDRVRGYTGLQELIRSRGWERRKLGNYMPSEAAAPEGADTPR
jgi:hypothetical protein